MTTESDEIRPEDGGNGLSSDRHLSKNELAAYHAWWNPESRLIKLVKIEREKAKNRKTEPKDTDIADWRSSAQVYAYNLEQLGERWNTQQKKILIEYWENNLKWVAKLIAYRCQEEDLKGRTYRISSKTLSQLIDETPPRVSAAYQDKKKAYAYRVLKQIGGSF